MRECPICGIQFEPEHGRQKYCSEEHSVEARRRRQRRGVEQATCDICGEDFKPYRSGQRYCGEKCRDEASRARQRRPVLSVDDALDEAQARDEERQQRAELKKLTAEASKRKAYLEVIERGLDEFEPTPLIIPQKIDARPSHEWVILLSDWHVGAKIRLEETGAMYEQTAATTRDQVLKLWEVIRWLHEIESSGRVIDKIHLLVLGDMMDGSGMRPSQARKVDDVATVQTVWTFDLLSWLIRQILTIVRRLEIEMVGGNHSRMSQKPGNAGLGELDYVDTLDWLLGAMLERVFAKDIEDDRLQIVNWQNFFGYKQIADHNVVFEHGSSIKWSAGSYGGVPWYGIQNMGTRYGQMVGGPIDILAIGHGHRSAVLPNGPGWIISNGALPATSTYVQSGMKVVARPQQTILSLHREMGMTGWLPIYADVPGQLKQGQIWENTEKYRKMANPRERTHLLG